MKIIATIILAIFTLVQVAPAVQQLFSNSSGIVFSIDEEKGLEKTECDCKKEKKDYPFIAGLIKIESLKSSVAFHEADKIHAHPCMEMLIPPPNIA